VSKTTLVLGDCHFPFVKQRVFDQLAKLITKICPARIVQVGDMLDGYAISSHAKEHGKPHPSLYDEVRMAGNFAQQLLDCAKDVRFLEGNHEERLRRRLADEPDLASTHPTMQSLLGIPEKLWTPYRKHLTIGKVTYAHDIGFSGKSATRASLAAFGGNLVFGHTHRAEVAYTGNSRGERHVCMNVGWLGDFDQMDYLPDSRKNEWQVAVGFVDETHRGNVAMLVAPFVDGQFLLRGL
jgi:UDP-2,3-diacylglucosamine pyrophosphatase LpxH